MKKVILLIALLLCAAYMGTAQEKYASYHTGDIEDSLGIYKDAQGIYVDMFTLDENYSECQGVAIPGDEIDLFCEFIEYMQHEYMDMIEDAEDNEIRNFMAEIKYQYSEARLYFHVDSMRSVVTSLHATIMVINGQTMIKIKSPGVASDQDNNIKHEGVILVFTSVDGFESLISALNTESMRPNNLADSF